MKIKKWGLHGISVLLVISAPMYLDSATMNGLIQVLITAVFAMGFNVLWGQTGLLSFGHAAYFGIGVFATLHLMNGIAAGFPFPTPLIPLVGAFSGMVVGVIAGWFATIRTGVYFAMITLALGELFLALAQRWDSLFGGEEGIRSIRCSWRGIGFQSLTDVYYFTVLWSVLAIALIYFFKRSPFGLIAAGIREKEKRIRFLGYDAHLVKTVVFSFSAAISGLAGSLAAFANESANLAILDTGTSSKVLLNTVVGGANVLLGPAAGAILMTSLEYFAGVATHFWPLYNGIIFIVIVMVLPQGIGGLAVDLKAWKAKAGTATFLRCVGEVLIGCCGIIFSTILLVESVGRLKTNTHVSSGSFTPIFGRVWDPSSWFTWIVAISCLVCGIALVRKCAHRMGTSCA